MPVRMSKLMMTEKSSMSAALLVMLSDQYMWFFPSYVGRDATGLKNLRKCSLPDESIMTSLRAVSMPSFSTRMDPK